MRAGFFLGDDTCEGKLERDVSHSSLNVRVWNEGEECVRRIKRTVRSARDIIFTYLNSRSFAISHLLITFSNRSYGCIHERSFTKTNEDVT